MRRRLNNSNGGSEHQNTGSVHSVNQIGIGTHFMTIIFDITDK